MKFGLSAMKLSRSYDWHLCFLGVMSKNSKLTIVITCGAFGALHWVLLAILSALGGGSCMGGLSLLWLEYPVLLIWPPSDSRATGVYVTCILVGGTLMFMLAGLLFGFALCGLRRLFKWLNDERWLNQP